MNLNNFWDNVKKMALFKKYSFLEKLFEDKVRAGLDIGAFAVKAVVMKRTAKGWCLQKMGYREIERLSEENEETNDGKIVQAIRELWKNHSIKTKRVRLTLSDEALYTRHISVPTVAEEELKNAIKWQAEKYAPFAVENAVVDFQLLDSSIKKDENQMDIVLVAAEQKTIDRYIDILEQCGLKPIVINISSFSVTKAVLKAMDIDKDEIIPVVDIGHKRTSIIVMRGESLFLVRNIDSGGSRITRCLQNGLHISEEEAENMKKGILFFPEENDNSTTEKEYFSYIQEPLSELAEQIDRSLAYCESSLAIENIKRIVLCGGGANFKGLKDFLSKKLNLRVEVMNSFKNTYIGKTQLDSSDGDEIIPKLTAAFGGVFDETD